MRHPNVVTIYGAERIDDRVGLWMEFVNGRTLEQVIAQGHTFGPSEATEIGVQLCHAVAAVHAAGLVHRDVKAHNVMLAEDRRVVLMDFGSGRELGDDRPAASREHRSISRQRCSAVGRPRLAATSTVLACCCITCSPRSYPVRGSDFRALHLAHQRGERTDLRTARPDLPPKLIRVVDRAIDTQPERRPQSASALAAELGCGQARSATRASRICGRGRGRHRVGGLDRNGTATSASRSASRATVASRPQRAAAISPADRPIIAVLPLKNLSSEPDSDYFVDGLTDELIRNLAVIEGLDVRSQTSSFAFKDKPRNLREVGEQLGANLVVEGSVLRSGNQLRINAQLVQVAGDVPLWSDRFDRELKDVFAIQDEIARAIVNQLRLTLGRGQRRYDTNPEAYELFLKARAMVARPVLASAQKAAELFEQVIEKDAELRSRACRAR